MISSFMSREMVHYYKQMYPKGTRICVDSMENDPNPILSGTCGKVDFVDDAGTIHCVFDDGRTLGIIPNEDRFHVVEEQELTEEQREEIQEDLTQNEDLDMNMG